MENFIFCTVLDVRLGFEYASGAVAKCNDVKNFSKNMTTASHSNLHMSEGLFAMFLTLSQNEKIEPSSTLMKA